MSPWVLFPLNGRIRANVPGEIVCPGVGRPDHPDGSAFGEGSEGIEGPDAGADIGAAGNDGLLRLTGSLGVKNVEHEPLLFEKAGMLAKLGK
jgi:hypothetical protein